MKTKLKIEREVDIRTLVVRAKVRNWGNAEVDGTDDTEGNKIPCRDGKFWKPIIDIDSGSITNWTQGTTAKIHYKIADCCGWELVDKEGNILLSAEDGYVPPTLSPSENGFGDYIIMNIDENGIIEEWEFDISDFIED